MKSIASIRKDYTLATLDIKIVDKNPIKQFERWFDDAMKSKIVEPTAMNLATITANGRPSSRIVLLKGIEQNQFVFYTNYQSQKGVELEDNPNCALTFFWPDLERQIRIEGVATRVPASTSDDYFKSRPRGSQVGAWASPQSTLIKDRKILEDRVAEIEKRYKGKEVLPRPNQWGGFGVAPFEIEFWQGRSSRLHDRIVYTKVDQEWKINRLAP
ncbi:MAG: pyridoxamine 5'-phosphate oxidase [Bacteroidia bacterium]|nr:pyridoxamine 5'-phosphate oxidase [Bacteroidia bacterium]